MGIILAFTPLIFFFVLLVLLRCYMTEKRKFTFKDKLILTIGGFFALLTVGLITNEIVFILMAFPFLFHAIILVLPVYISIWKDFFHIIRRYRRR